MTGAELMGVILFFATISGVLWGIWWRVEGKIEAAKKDATIKADAAQQLAALTDRQLAEHKLHVAENYVTKAGLREATEHIMEAIAGVRGSIDALGSRMDRVLEHRNGGG